MQTTIDINVDKAKLALQIATGEDWSKKTEEEVKDGVMDRIKCYGVTELLDILVPDLSEDLPYHC